ncbi:TPA: YegP family protein [Staphylococcus delphini]|nr:YegP family protein [Staphylococcus delphini]
MTSNGEIVATSETYIHKSSALSTIESMKKGINSESQVIDVSD